MNIQEITEGSLKNYAIDKEFDRQYGKQPEPTVIVKQPTTTHHITINGTPWKRNGELVSFTSYDKALSAANNIYAKRPRLRIDIVPH
jgi:hypothetical protein